MKKNKNIDDLFREAAEGFEMQPSAEAWGKIESAHFTPKTKSKIPYWWILLVLLIPLFLYFFLPDLIDKEDETPAFTKDFVEFEEMEDSIIEIPVKKESFKINVEKNVPEKEEVPGRTVQPEKKEIISMQTSEVNFGLNVAGVQTGFDVNNVKLDNLKKLNSLSVYEFYSESNNNLYQREIPGLEEYIEKKSNLHFYSGLGGTVGMMYYPATRDQFTYSADFSFGLKIKKVYLETGIGYQEMKEEGTVIVEFLSKDSIGYINKVLSFEVDPNNPSEIIYNTLKTTIYDSINHFTVTYPLYQYQYLNFPFSVGYKIFDKDKLIFTAQAGFTFSTMIGESVENESFSNPDYQIVEMINTTPPRVKNNFQMQLALRFGYRITSGLSVIAQPVFSKYMNSIYDTKAGYQSIKPYTMGVRFGIYYYF